MSRCACGAQYTTEQWGGLRCVGVMSDGAEGYLELRDCAGCGSTISTPVDVSVASLETALSSSVSLVRAARQANISARDARVFIAALASLPDGAAEQLVAEARRLATGGCSGG